MKTKILMKKIQWIFLLIVFAGTACKKENSHKPDTSYKPRDLGC